MKLIYDFDEVIERVTRAMEEMSGEEIEKIVNREFGMELKYIGDSQFEALDKQEE